MTAKSMQDVWEAITKVHGDEGLFVGDSDMTAYSSEVIPTGSYALDEALGINGWPRGHIVQLAGFEQSGKTLMALSAVKQWQSMNEQNWAMFIDAEFSFNKEWAESLGVDTSRLMVYRENKGTEIFSRLIGVPGKPAKDGTIKKVKLGILDMEAENPTGLGVIILDSVASMQVPMEEASKPGKATMALMARFLPPELRKLTPLLTATGILFIAINQLRFDPGVMYGDPTKSGGGQALKHACAIMANFAMITKKDTAIEENGVQIGHRIRAKIQKNKKAPPFRTAEFDIEYLKGVVNRNVEVRDIGARYGVIERPNNRTWMLDGVKYNGVDDITNALQDETLQLSVLDRSREAKKMGKAVSVEDDTMKDDGESETWVSDSECDEEAPT